MSSVYMRRDKKGFISCQSMRELELELELAQFTTIHALCHVYLAFISNQTITLFVFSKACNFVYLNAVPTEMLTGPCAVQKAVSSTLKKASGSFTPTIVNLKVSLKGVTLTDINRK